MLKDRLVEDDAMGKRYDYRKGSDHSQSGGTSESEAVNAYVEEGKKAVECECVFCTNAGSKYKIHR